MIIIQLAGGLGNQMFQYALYLQLKSLDRTVKIDDVSGFVQDKQREPALMPFGISYERASAQELERMLDSSMLPWDRVRRKLCGRKKKAYFEADKRYKPEIMEWDDIYLEGYWQTEKYFQTVSQEVRQAYDVDGLLRYLGVAAEPCRKRQNSEGQEFSGNRIRRAEDWLADITSTRSVSVHIRRGDYLLPENKTLFGGICTEEYYRTAMKTMRQEYPDCRFYLFTNDKEWAKAGIDVNCYNINVVDIEETNDYLEFALMSKCKHHILANSSFSWWASYLNQNPNKTVLAPDRWLNGWDCEDFYRQDMRKVRTKL